MAKKVRGPANWNVMVFMGAEGVPGETDLRQAADDDLLEMAELFDEHPEGPLNLFVQVNRRDKPERFDVRTSERFDIDASEQDATNGKALIAFMRWAFERAVEFKETPTMLILWGHAYEFAIGRAVRPTGIDALDFTELTEVLGCIQKDRGKKLEIVAFDACDLATTEVAYQFCPYADYLLASEIGIPIPGWPYNRVFERVVDTKRDPMSPAELGTYIVRRFCENYRADELTVSLTLLDLACAPALVNLTETLARKLAIAMADDADECDLVSDVFFRSQTIEEKPFVDVADLCLNLVRESRYPAVIGAAEKLGDFVINAAPPPVDGKTDVGRFVLEHGRNACRTAKIQGISLYAPHIAPPPDVGAADIFYNRLEFAKKTLWADVVHGLAERS